jgi:hypothetical protein
MPSLSTSSRIAVGIAISVISAGWRMVFPSSRSKVGQHLGRTLLRGTADLRSLLFDLQQIGRSVDQGRVRASSLFSIHNTIIFTIDFLSCFLRFQLTFTTMDEQVDRLVKKTWAKFQEVPRSKRLMIAVSGIPGSGEISTVTMPCYTRLTTNQAKQLSHPS